MRKRNQDKRIFFPWERRGSLARRLGLQRARPFVWIGGLLCILIVIGVRERRAAGERRTRAIMRDVRSALDAYLAEHNGQCPRKFAELEPYGHFRGLPRDAWGTPLRLTCPAPGGDLPYLLSSDGPDRLPGGLDRIE